VFECDLRFQRNITSGGDIFGFFVANHEIRYLPTSHMITQRRMQKQKNYTYRLRVYVVEYVSRYVMRFRKLDQKVRVFIVCARFQYAAPIPVWSTNDHNHGFQLDQIYKILWNEVGIYWGVKKEKKLNVYSQTSLRHLDYARPAHYFERYLCLW